MARIPRGHIVRLGRVWRFAGHQRGLASITAVAIGALLTVGASTVYVVVSPQVADSARTDPTSQVEPQPVHASPAIAPGPPTPTPSPTPSLADMVAILSPGFAYARQLSLDAAGSFDTRREIIVRYLNGDIHRFDAVGPVSTSPGTESGERGFLVKLQWRNPEGNPVEFFIPPDGVASVEVHYKDARQKPAP